MKWNFKELSMALLMLCIVVAGISCMSTKRNNLSVMRLGVDQKIEIGMELADAEDAMKSLGFDCTLKLNGTLNYYAKQNAISKTKLQNVNFLKCVAHAEGIVSAHLTVALLVTKEKVYDIIFVTDYIGP